MFLVILASALAVMASESVIIHGQSVMVKNIERFSDTGNPSFGELVESTTFDFADGNQITLSDAVWLSQSGQISLAVNPGSLNYRLKSGEQISLNCRERFLHQMNRIVAFHSNGRYHRNCEMDAEHTFSSAHYSLTAALRSSIDLQENGDLEYLGAANQGSWVELPGSGRALLNHGSSVAIHPSGLPRFFTLAAGEELKFSVPGRGKLRVTTLDSQVFATVLYENGRLESATLVDPIFVPFEGQILPLKVSFASFYRSGEIAVVNLLEVPDVLRPMVVQNRQGHNILCLSQSGQPRQLSYCQEQLSSTEVDR